DLPSFFSPFPNLNDRGKALEEAWQKQLVDIEAGDGSVRKVMETTLADLRPREKAGQVPSLVFSPMMVEDGRRLVISRVDRRHMAARRGRRLGPESSRGRATDEVLYSVEALELFRLFPRSKSALTLATAARMSASFPYLSPAVSLPTY